MTGANVERLARHRIRRATAHSIARVDEACSEGQGWKLHTDLVEKIAEIMASTAYLELLADCSETDFWSLPEALQARVVDIGFEFADVTRDVFAAAVTDAGVDVLTQVWRDAASRFQAHVDRLLLAASHGGGHA